MRIGTYISLVAVLCVAGCSKPTPEPLSSPPEKPTARSVRVLVVNTNLHLGHNILKNHAHSIWRNGCKAKLQDSGQRLTIWWDGGERVNYSFPVDNEKVYDLHYTGEIATSGVFLCEGKSLHIAQIAEVKEVNGETSNKMPRHVP